MSERIKAYWTEMHQRYSERGLGVKPTKFAHEVLEYLPESGSLLDLGAGQGQDSRFFAKHGFEVTSTDLTPTPLELSKKLSEKEGLTIAFQEVDISRQLPFENNAFDIVYSHMALHYFDKKVTERLFAEIHRVLKPNGIFATLLNTVEDAEATNSDFKKIEQDLYQNPSGITKRYFSVETMHDFTRDYFKVIILDNKGKTYKDVLETLIRFVGNKKVGT